MYGNMRSLVRQAGAFFQLRQKATPGAPGSGLAELYYKTGDDDDLYFRAGAAGIETRLVKAIEVADNPLTTTGDMIYAVSTTPTRLALPTRGYVYMAGASIPTGEPLARKNRLLNGGMRVKQRTTLGSTDNTFTLDRWRLLLGAANAATVVQGTSDFPSDGSGSVITLSAGSGNNNKFGIFQVLPYDDCVDLRGKKVSLQFKMKATAGIGDVKAALLYFIGTADAVTGDPITTWGSGGAGITTFAANWSNVNSMVNLTPTTSWATYRLEDMTVSTGANNVAVIIYSDDTTTTQTTDVLRITDVQLEEGSVCTQVERRPLALERQLCYWFYRELTPASDCYLGSGNNYNTTSTLVGLRRDEMRIVPTTSYAAASNFKVLDAAGNFVTATSISTYGSTDGKYGVTANVGVASGLVAGNGTMMFSTGANATIAYSADL